jgi:hypothetical protein
MAARTTKTDAKTSNPRAGSGAPVRGTRPKAAGPPDTSVKVRMYRQGLGDCLLLRIPRAGGQPPFAVLIDCGVVLGTENAASKMTDVVNDIIGATGGTIDLLVVTHEHWDHVSGFVQTDLFGSKLKVRDVWLAWTEDPKDEIAATLKAQRHAMRLALTQAEAGLRLAGQVAAADDTASLLGFFGASPTKSTNDAMEAAKALGTVRFCRPTDDPVPLADTGVRAFVLGPPLDTALLKRVNPSTRQPETYGFAGTARDFGAAAATDADADLAAPFDPKYQVPLAAAAQMPFFRGRYWGEDGDSADQKDQSWRRIDGSWLEDSTGLALQLDSATNNTSLVLAFERPGGDVLLFAADAQVGSWLSWPGLTWTVDGKTVRGADLIRRTVLYKVGHHGSHNATVRDGGLEAMTGLQCALLPVDHAMAVTKRWGNMPLPGLVDRLDAITRDHVLRIDADPPAAMTGLVSSTALYHEITL